MSSERALRPALCSSSSSSSIVILRLRCPRSLLLPAPPLCPGLQAPQHVG
ncbi:MAG: hypothetical protein LBO05_09435 [Deltaproteobacteria bacterium]|nr:hypothetical protein [Deltaproteobacteria bacterium]